MYRNCLIQNVSTNIISIPHSMNLSTLNAGLVLLTKIGMLQCKEL